MTPFMRMRESVRNLIRAHEIAFDRIGHGFIMLVCLAAIAWGFPFAGGIDSVWVILVLSVLGMFMPFSAQALLVIVFLLVNLFALSGQIAGVTAVIILAAYAFCSVFLAQKTHYIPGFVAARLWSAPGIIPMQIALLGSLNEVVVVISGAVVSFYLQEVHVNAGLLKDGENQMPVIDFIRERIIANQMFYVYIFAMIVMFLAVYTIRSMNIAHSWGISVVGGTAAEFLILLSGYLLIGSRKNIPMLILGNIVVLLVGAATNYLYRDFDYTRTEKVQFEDDDYYYYVTAVPKIRLTEEKKEVKTINRVSKTRRGRGK